jgi:hypothetical protein
MGDVIMSEKSDVKPPIETIPSVDRGISAACVTVSGKRPETVSNLGVAWVGPIMADRGNGMKWRVMVELTGSDGIVRPQEVSVGGSNGSECSAGTVGLMLADGKRTLAGLQEHLVRAQADEYCRQRRGCSHCGSERFVLPTAKGQMPHIARNVIIT